jgi:hypothetical protein
VVNLLARLDHPYKNEAEDKFYISRGVKPPERTAHITEDELREALALNLEGHRCDWQQNGAEIFCDIGNFEHGRRIGTRVRLAGTDANSQPVLVPVGPILRKDVVSG